MHYSDVVVDLVHDASHRAPAVKGQVRTLEWLARSRMMAMAIVTGAASTVRATRNFGSVTLMS